MVSEIFNVKYDAIVALPALP